MKTTFLGVAILLILNQSVLAQAISPYFDLGAKSGSISEVSTEVQAIVESSGYPIIGTYLPGNQSDLAVIVFTNDATRSTCSRIGSQGLIASTYRIGLELKGKEVLVSAVNPEYQWRAYLTTGYEDNMEEFGRLNSNFQSLCSSIQKGPITSFGGEVSSSDLEDYHYMIGMPYYDDQVKVGSFSSFEEATSKIEKQLALSSSTQLVYTLKDKEAQLSIYGIGLLDQEKGEKHFLSIIGQKHVAALPYELIVEGSKVYMLHGRFRFALYWPELTMGTFTKIMSTPGDVENFMKTLVE